MPQFAFCIEDLSDSFADYFFRKQLEKAFRSGNVLDVLTLIF